MIAAAGAVVGRGPLVALDSRVKIVVTLTLIVGCVTAATAGVLFAYALLLAALHGAAAVPPRWLAVRLAPALVLGGLVALGAAWPGSSGVPWARVGAVLARALLGIAAVSWLVATTGLPRLLRGLERLRVPPALVDLIAVSHRYGLLLADEAHRLGRAATARGGRARWLWQVRAVGRVVAALFLRAYERGERVHAAMLARGLEQQRPAVPARPLRACDWIGGCGLLALAVAPRFLV